MEPRTPQVQKKKRKKIEKNNYNKNKNKNYTFSTLTEQSQINFDISIYNCTSSYQHYKVIKHSQLFINHKHVRHKIYCI